MRPVRRNASPLDTDYDDYKGAKGELVSRLGSYCSYCERRIPTNLAVEHIQPKALPPYEHLVGRWENFLLACVNCNSTKGDKDVVLRKVLLPDRDNTFAAFFYGPDGTVSVRPGLSPEADAAGRATLQLVGLDRKGADIVDANGKSVALDRPAQRMEIWLMAEAARADLAANRSPALLKSTVTLARQAGYFSVWMTVFADDPKVRQLLIEEFSGTEESECFDHSGSPVCPAPNPDGLPDGGKV